MSDISSKMPEILSDHGPNDRLSEPPSHGDVEDPAQAERSLSTNSDTSTTAKRLSVQAMAHMPQKFVSTNPSNRMSSLVGRKASLSESSTFSIKTEGDDVNDSASAELGDVYGGGASNANTGNDGAFKSGIDDKVRKRLSSVTSNRPIRTSTSTSTSSLGDAEESVASKSPSPTPSPSPSPSP